MTQPHSDKSARARRRATARELSKATQVQPGPASIPNPGGGITVSIPDLLAKIGALTVERDILQNQLAQSHGHIERLVAEAELVDDEEDPGELERPAPGDKPAD